MAAVRGIHYFESFWQPKENELLCCHFKIRNFYDIFNVITCNEKGSMGSHDHLNSLALQKVSSIKEQKLQPNW